MRTAWPQVLTLAFIVGSAGAACDDPPPPDPAPTPPGDVVTADDGTRFAVDVVAQNLEIPWAMAFAPDGRMFLTERPGRVRVFERGQVLAAPALVLTDVAAVGEGGLLGIAVHPDFATNHFVFLAYTARLAGGSRETRVVRYREVGNTLGEPAVILDRVGAADIHDGARVKFGPDRKLYVTMGDTAAPPTAQDLGTLTGKILRLNDDGSVPGDNPFAGSPIFSYGHRNPQGLDWHPVTGEPWGSEHGQTGNDEINRLQPGHNYGWPVIEADQTRAGMETPILFFSPSIAPSGASFYTGTAIAGFRAEPVRRRAGRAAPAPRPLRSERSEPGRRDGAAPRRPLRPDPRRRQRSRRRALSVHEQPRRPEHAGRGRRPPRQAVRGTLILQRLRAGT